ncbi:MAG: hypothetical protein O7G32_07750 [SAR324 cluster bacterium]|nr:hypothetical protein [SAR324 cluster bacterium]
MRQAAPTAEAASTRGDPTPPTTPDALPLEGPRKDAALHKRLGAKMERIAKWRRAGKAVLGVAPVAAWDLKCWPMASYRELMESFVRRTRTGHSRCVHPHRKARLEGILPQDVLPQVLARLPCGKARGSRKAQDPGKAPPC